MAAVNIACIDIGSSKVCTIVAKVNDGRIAEVFGVGQAASRGVQKGVIVDIEDATRAVRESVENAQGNAMPKVGSILVGFSGKHITSANTVVTVDNRRTDHLITEAAIREVRRKIASASIGEDRVEVNIIDRQYAIDRVAGVRNPLGMHGLRLDVEAHVISADIGCMRSLVACLDRAGVSVSSDSFVANPLASSEAVLEPEDKERGAIVADIGGGTTGIAVFKDGSIWHTAVLPVGGRQVTSDLAMALSIP
ncbi:MAG: cell division protein FtsA, partial [Chloroflexi bacterium RBG_13_54_8]